MFISNRDGGTIEPAGPGEGETLTDVWARKSVVDLLAEAAHSDSGSEVRPLKRALSATNLVGLGIGGIIGAGIFVLTGHAAAANAGPAVTLSFLLGAVACAFAGLCYAEMASTVPISGSAYTYAYTTLGEWIAWIIGWDLVLEYAVGSSTVSISWSASVVSLLHTFGINLPAQFISGPFEAVKLPDGTTAQGIANIPAVIIVFLISMLLMIGIKE